MTSTVEEALVGYFGFGSLVNPKTLRTDYVQHLPARLRGWQRHWQVRSDSAERFNGNAEELVLLSIHEDKDCIIDGAIVIDRAVNLSAVDEREAGYDRVKLDPSNLEISGDAILPDEIYVYVAHAADSGRVHEGALLQSYLDAVMQGYKASFGEAGVSNFIETTIGFNRGIVTDRAAPLYPRHVDVSESDRTLFDRELRRAGVRFS